MVNFVSKSLCLGLESIFGCLRWTPTRVYNGNCNFFNVSSHLEWMKAREVLHSILGSSLFALYLFRCASLVLIGMSPMLARVERECMCVDWMCEKRGRGRGATWKAWNITHLPTPLEVSCKDVIQVEQLLWLSDLHPHSLRKKHR